MRIADPATALTLLILFLMKAKVSNVSWRGLLLSTMRTVGVLL